MKAGLPPLLLAAACSGGPAIPHATQPAAAIAIQARPAAPAGPLAARLDAAAAASPDFAALAAAFAHNNPGCRLQWLPEAASLPSAPSPRAAFVQAGKGMAAVCGPDGARARELGLGDLIVLRPDEELRCDEPLSLLVFEVASPPPDGVPTFVRPDWDPRITDTPGGCATDQAAYRRVLVTWREQSGPYTWRAINAHRVRIDDSFTHYHPVQGGFDEFYLVQAAETGAELLTTTAVAAIEDGTTIGPEHVPGLLQRRPLRQDDLVYLPRGTAHRGLGGALVQVITVPGFVPGAEIGIDHRLRALNERLGLQGEQALPLHAPAAHGPVVR